MMQPVLLTSGRLIMDAHSRREEARKVYTRAVEKAVGDRGGE